MNMSEIIVILLIYSGLFIYFLISFDVKNKKKSRLFPAKSFLALGLYMLMVSTIWGMYKAEEWQMNEHSGYPPIYLMNEALLLIVGVSIYSILLFVIMTVFRMKKRKG
ncbi:peptide ABC transporter permease [Lysinibacillus sp. KU-BSD001]|uniref:peptide ABC transporter permease n=1 Tax=Lysinibacillus sp. KU-BSD001 TaxID=3141328 RepID=UPI0036EB8D60